MEKWILTWKHHYLLGNITINLEACFQVNKVGTSYLPWNHNWEPWQSDWNCRIGGSYIKYTILTESIRSFCENWRPLDWNLRIPRPKWNSLKMWYLVILWPSCNFRRHIDEYRWLWRHRWKNGKKWFSRITLDMSYIFGLKYLGNNQ